MVDQLELLVCTCMRKIGTCFFNVVNLIDYKEHSLNGTRSFIQWNKNLPLK